MKFEGQGLRKDIADLGIEIVRASGSHYFASNGKKYLDLSSSYSVCLFGHGHPSIRKGLQNQIEDLVHCPPGYPNVVRQELAEKICGLSGFEEPRVIWSVLGTQAIEVALNLAHTKNKKRGVIVFEGGYHGKSNFVGPLNTKGNFAGELDLATEHVRLPYPLDPSVHKESYCSEDFAQIQNFFKDLGDNHQFSSLLIEPVQGSAGVRFCDPKALEYIVEAARSKDIVVVFDEIQSGFYRTGPRWSYQPTNCRPDVMVVGKAFGGELPVSAVLAEAALMSDWPEGLFSSTFLTNALGHRSALEFLKLLESYPVEERVLQLEAIFQEELGLLGDQVACCEEVRGRGAFWGVQLGTEGSRRVAHDMAKEGMLIAITGVSNDTLRFAPPLTVDDQELRAALSAVRNYCLKHLS